MNTNVCHIFSSRQKYLNSEDSYFLHVTNNLNLQLNWCNNFSSYQQTIKINLMNYCNEFSKKSLKYLKISMSISLFNHKCNKTVKKVKNEKTFWWPVSHSIHKKLQIFFRIILSTTVKRPLLNFFIKSWNFSFRSIFILTMFHELFQSMNKRAFFFFLFFLFFDDCYIASTKMLNSGLVFQ